MVFPVAQHLATIPRQNLDQTQTSLSRVFQRLTTGLRINEAADDAAGLSIAEALRSQVRGLNQAARNAQDGVSLVQTAENGLDMIAGKLHRMRELAVQAGNDTLSATEREAVQTEIDYLAGEIDRVATTTAFNRRSLLDTDDNGFRFQVGAQAGQLIAMTLEAADSAALSVDSLDVSTQAGASAALSTLGEALLEVSARRGRLGAVQNRLEFALANLNGSVEKHQQAESRIRDADTALEMVHLVRFQAQQQAGAMAALQANVVTRAFTELF
jgi:flagellin